MIKGRVNEDLDPVIRLSVRGPNGRKISLEVLIDTGFDGALTLPSSLVTQLGLPWRRREEAILADGNASTFDTYEGTVVWNRRHLMIPVDQLDAMPLVGTQLLDGHELNAEFRPDGQVTIRPLRRRRR